MGATIAAGALAIPIEPIPGLDVLYDIGAPLLLLLYWVSFSRMRAARFHTHLRDEVRRSSMTADDSPSENEFYDRPAGFPPSRRVSLSRIGTG